MDKTRIIPPDPVEAAQASGVEVEAAEPETTQRSDTATDPDPAKQRAYAENEGLVKPVSRNAQSIEASRGQGVDERVQAEQRGRTA